MVLIFIGICGMPMNAVYIPGPGGLFNRQPVGLCPAANPTIASTVQWSRAPDWVPIYIHGEPILQSTWKWIQGAYYLHVHVASLYLIIQEHVDSLYLAIINITQCHTIVSVVIPRLHTVLPVVIPHILEHCHAIWLAVFSLFHDVR